MKKIALYISICLIISIGFLMYTSKNTGNNEDFAGRGCCSSHGGVCGCQNGRARCCDGSLSPSCQCFKDDIKGICI